MSDCNESDKENVTPYRCKELLASYLDDKDTSSLSEVSVYTPHSNLNSTTSVLNSILERVNVRDNITSNSEELECEVSFDVSAEDKKQTAESPADKKGDFKEPTFLEKTPNDRRNPFDMSTMDNFPDMSPNVFAKEQAEDAADFKWSIDHISELNPVDISGDQPSYILEAQKKEYNDEKHQKTVTSFFKSCVIAPSPCVRNKTAPQSRNNVSFGEDKESQTNISLPVDFDLESILGEKFQLEKSERSISDSSFRRMLFDTEPPTEREEEVRELSEPDYIEELQSSPLIKEDNISPFSNSNPSFEICSEDNPLSGPMLSPIGCKPMSALFQTPARMVRGGLQSTPGPSYLGSTPGYLCNTPSYPTTTPGRRVPNIIMSTPAPASMGGEVLDVRTPASKRRLTPDKNPLFKNSQFASPFISPIPKSRSHIKRHPKCPKRIRIDVGSPRKAGSNSPRKHVDFVESPVSDILSPAGSLPSPASTVDSPAGSLPSPDSLIPKQVPMESSRIESGGDVSSEGEREKTKLMQMGLQPLDISEIKVQDNSKKLRTNNYLDISASHNPKQDMFSPPTFSPPTFNSHTDNNMCSEDNNTCYHDNNTCACLVKEEVRSKDSGFGTSSAMSAMATSTLPPTSETTLPPLSEKMELLMDSRPGKRKKYELSPRSDDLDESDFQPPPVKRVVIAAKNGTTRRKHRSLE